MGMGSSSGQGSGISDSSESQTTAASESSARRRQQDNRYEKSCFFKYVTAIARTWGILLLIGVWGCTVRTFTRTYKYAQYYLLAVAVVVTFLELVWILNKCFLACCRDEGCCCRVWKAIVWVDDWRKAVLYLLLTLPCYFTKELRTLFPLLAVGLLIVAAVLYFLKSFRNSSCVQTPVEECESGGESGGERTDPKAPLMSSEQRAYDSLASPPTSREAVSAVTSPQQSVRPESVTSSECVGHSPVTSSDSGKRPSPGVPADDDDAEVPTGYRHDYGAPRGDYAPPGQGHPRPRSSNPFDDERDVTDAAGRAGSGLKRAPSTNPFDDDYVAPVAPVAAAPRPKSTNPFDES